MKRIEKGNIVDMALGVLVVLLVSFILVVIRTAEAEPHTFENAYTALNLVQDKDGNMYVALIGVPSPEIYLCLSKFSESGESDETLCYRQSGDITPDGAYIPVEAFSAGMEVHLPMESGT